MIDNFNIIHHIDQNCQSVETWLAACFLMSLKNNNKLGFSIVLSALRLFPNQTNLEWYKNYFTNKVNSKYNLIKYQKNNSDNIFIHVEPEIIETIDLEFIKSLPKIKTVITSVKNKNFVKENFNDVEIKFVEPYKIEDYKTRNINMIYEFY